jgi:hypothetical protein
MSVSARELEFGTNAGSANRSIRPGENQMVCQDYKSSNLDSFKDVEPRGPVFLTNAQERPLPSGQVDDLQLKEHVSLLIFQGWLQKSRRWTRARNSLTPIYIFCLGGVPPPINAKSDRLPCR